MEKNNELEKGMVLAINDVMFLKGNRVMLNFETYSVQIGTLPSSEIYWFPITQSSKPVDFSTITQIVYLGETLFGVKQFTDAVDEFRSLSLADQNKILLDYLYLCEAREASEHEMNIREY